MPYANPFREERRILMQELLVSINKLGECEITWILGWGGLKWGSTEEALMRMLKQLEHARMIEIDLEQHKIISLHPIPKEPEPTKGASPPPETVATPKTSTQAPKRT